jgi:hypothetical protein
VCVCLTHAGLTAVGSIVSSLVNVAAGYARAIVCVCVCVCVCVL